MIKTLHNPLTLDFRKILLLAAAIALMASYALPVFATPNNASLQLSDSRPSNTSTYTLTLSNINNTTTGCVTVDLGATNDDASSAAYDASSTAFTTASGWTDGSTTNQLQITNSTPTTPDSTSSATLVWTGVTNGDTADTAYDATYTAYSDAACTSQITDETLTVQYMFTEGTSVSLTVDPAFTFSVNAVTSGNNVDPGDGSSASTTVTTTATTVPFGQVGTGSNGVAAQRLDISTNAQNGYNIYFRQSSTATDSSGNLVKSGDNTVTIDELSVNNSCTYSSPGSFPSAGADEAFGFTTNDSDISTGNYTSPSGSAWCDVTNSDQVVSSETAAPTGTDQTYIGYQVAVDAGTDSGSYSNTVIYTAVPTY